MDSCNYPFTGNLKLIGYANDVAHSSFSNANKFVIRVFLRPTASMDERLARVSKSVVGVEFKSRAGQILHSVANGSPPLQHLLK